MAGASRGRNASGSGGFPEDLDTRRFSVAAPPQTGFRSGPSRSLNLMTNQSLTPFPAGRRWTVAVAGTLLQTCLGTVYAWSYFQKPIMEQHGWKNEAVTWVFSLAICFLGLAAAWGGLQLKKGRTEPRAIAITGGLLFALGHLVTAAALWKSQLWLLLLGYGVIGGTGLGLAYVVPVATAARWFPDKKGLVTGMVVMGFGLGALLMSKVLAPLALRWFDGNLAVAFAAMGCVFAVLAPAAGAFMKNPPEHGDAGAEERESEGAKASAGPVTAAATAAAGDEGGWGKFGLLWLLFFCNIFVGISIISFQSPLLQDLLRIRNPDISAAQLASGGATLIACGAIFNGLGRFLWGAVSDRIGQSLAFTLMLGSQIAVFAVLPQVGSPLLFGGLVCYILLCYGGGFGAIPSYVLALFGEKRMALLYGMILTAWSAGGIAGPKFMAWLRDHRPADAAPVAFYCSAALLAGGLVLTFLPALGVQRPR